MEFTILPFRTDDAPRLAAFWERILVHHWTQSAFAFRRESERDRLLPMFSQESLLEKEAAPTSVVTYLLESDGEMMGTVRLSRNPGCPGGLVLSELNVDPRHHGRGYGKALVRACIEEAIARCATRVELLTWTFNRKGIPLYKRTGFYWLPGTSVTMYNYIPLIHRQDEAREFFAAHSWYDTYKRRITYRHDMGEGDDPAACTYLWEAEGDSFTATVDWRTDRIVRIGRAR